MSDEFRISHAVVAELGKSFQTHAYDLERYVTAFEETTGADALGEGETAAAYQELAEQTRYAMGELHRRFDTVGAALVATAGNSAATDDAVARLLPLSPGTPASRPGGQDRRPGG